MIRVMSKVKELDDIFDIGAIRTQLADYLKPDTVSVIVEKLTKIKHRYGVMECSYIPIYFDSDEYYSDIDLGICIASKFINYLERYIFLFEDIEFDSILKYKKLYGEEKYVENKTRDIDLSNSKTGNVTNVEINSGTDKTTTNNDSKFITENSPINSSIDVIDSPNYKSGNKNDSETTYERGGKKDVTDTYDVTTSNSGNIETNIDTSRVSPEKFKIYSEFMEMHNGLYILDKCFKRVLYEYNRGL